MSSRIPTLHLDPSTSYTIPQFLDLCKLNATVTEFVIIQIVGPRISENRKLSPDQINATGAEFLDAITKARRIAKMLRSRPVYIQVPGRGQINMSDPMPLLFTEMFKKLRK